MLYTQKLNLLKKIILIGLISSIIPLTVIILILGEISVLNSLLNNYIISGKSLFIPFLPSYNVFWFLPEEVQFIHFSIGHLVDMLIIISIISLIEIGGYQYYKKICLNEDLNDYDQLDSKQEVYIISQDQSIFFGLNEGSSFSCDNKLLSKKYKTNQNFNQGLINSFKYLRKNRNRLDFIRSGLLVNTILKKKKFQILRYLFNFEVFNQNLSNFHLIYPQIKANIKYPNSFQYRGIKLNYKAYNFKIFNNVIIKTNFIKKLIKYAKNR